MHNLLSRCELLFRWEHTSQAAIHLDACTLGPGIFLQLGLEVSSLMPPQGKLNPMDDSREKLSRDICVSVSILGNACPHGNTKEPTSTPQKQQGQVQAGVVLEIKPRV